MDDEDIEEIITIIQSNFLETNKNNNSSSVGFKFLNLDLPTELMNDNLMLIYYPQNPMGLSNNYKDAYVPFATQKLLLK